MDGAVWANLTDGMAHKISQQCSQALDDRRLSPGAARKLRSSMVWASSAACGKVGRAMQGELRKRQMASSYVVGVTEELRVTLQFAQVLVHAMPRRRVLVAQASSPPAFLYSDASFEPADVDAVTRQCRDGLDRPPRGKLGWICLPLAEPARAGTIDLSPATFALFEQRTQPVYMCETLAAVAATCTAERCCRGATCCSS